MNILFTCAGRRNYLLQFFRDALNGKGSVFAADMQLSAPAMAVADKAFLVPAVSALNYVETLGKICLDNDVNVIISLNDLELPVLASKRGYFESLGVKVLISDDDVIDIGFDKWKTKLFAEQLKIYVPKTFLSLESAISALEEGSADFPLVVKPRWGSASIGIEFPADLRELKLSYELLKIRLFKSSLADASNADAENAILIQEKIEGKEFGMDILNDLDGKPRQVYVKEKLAMRAGETDKSVLRNRPDIEAIGYKIGEALSHIGNLDCDVFDQNGKLYLLEINPRFGGGYPFTHVSGGKYTEALVSWLNGTDYDFAAFDRKFDQVFSKCDTLISVSSD